MAKVTQLELKVQEALKARGCGCQPRVDVKPFKAWLEEGLVVQKGQKAIPGTRLFCRCQTVEHEKNAKPKAKAKKAKAQTQAPKTQAKPKAKKAEKTQYVVTWTNKSGKEKRMTLNDEELAVKFAAQIAASAKNENVKMEVA